MKKLFVCFLVLAFSAIVTAQPPAVLDQEVALAKGGNPNVPVNEPHLYASQIDHQSFKAYWVWQDNPNKPLPTRMELLMHNPNGGGFDHHSDVPVSWTNTSVNVSTDLQGMPLQPNTTYKIKLKLWSGTHFQLSNATKVTTKRQPGDVLKIDCCVEPAFGSVDTQFTFTIYINSTYAVEKLVLDFADGKSKTVMNPGNPVTFTHYYKKEGKYHPTATVTTVKPETKSKDCCVVTVSSEPEPRKDECFMDDLENETAIPVFYVDEEENEKYEKYFVHLEADVLTPNPEGEWWLYKRVYKYIIDEETGQEGFECDLYGFIGKMRRVSDVVIPGSATKLEHDDFKVSKNKKIDYLWVWKCKHCRNDRYFGAGRVVQIPKK